VNAIASSNELILLNKLRSNSWNTLKEGLKLVLIHYRHTSDVSYYYLLSVLGIIGINYYESIQWNALMEQCDRNI
jgi:hypothetical protein